MPLDELPEPPTVSDGQDVATLSAPHEQRGIVLSLECCKQSHSELDVLLTHFKQGHNGRLRSFHFGESISHRSDAGGSTDLINLLEISGSGVKLLTVADPWKLPLGGVSGLASACPKLKKVEFGWGKLNEWVKDVFPESLRKVTIWDCNTADVDIDIDSSRAVLSPFLFSSSSGVLCQTGNPTHKEAVPQKKANTAAAIQTRQKTWGLNQTDHDYCVDCEMSIHIFIWEHPRGLRSRNRFHSKF